MKLPDLIRQKACIKTLWVSSILKEAKCDSEFIRYVYNKLEYNNKLYNKFIEACASYIERMSKVERALWGVPDDL